jgi:hypothetical protein
MKADQNGALFLSGRKTPTLCQDELLVITTRIIALSPYGKTLSILKIHLYSSTTRPSSS